ncbi:hypothetical protein EDD11_010344 [Mortierella claussenii]|nr:hypothetical protein EDD11_010344 [Mortierella claussenii]
MASWKGKAPVKPARTTYTSADLSNVSEAYLQELKETFRLYDTEHTGLLSLKKLRLAMRTLGFEASLDDIEEIVQDMPSLSIHNAKKKKKPSAGYGGSKKRGVAASTTKDKGKKKDPGQSGADEASSSRRSSRAAVVTLKKGSRSKYVDESDEDAAMSGGDEEDIYEGAKQATMDHGTDDGDSRQSAAYDDLCFNLQDFITIMVPSEEPHGQDEVSRVFQLFDMQGKGSIRIEDLRRVATELDIPMKDEELREMIEEADRDGDGGVTELEFARIMKKTGF